MRKRKPGTRYEIGGRGYVIGKDGRRYPDRRAERSYSWAGGRQPTGHGYIEVVAYGHPHADERGRVLEHVFIASSVLGRPLPAGTVVHHFDGTRSNNVKTNLVICEDQGYHRMLHRRQAAYEACGDANKFQCRHCKCWDTEENMKVFRLRKKTGEPNGWQAYHRSCHTAAARKAS